MTPTETEVKDVHQKHSQITWWQARNLRSAKRNDVWFLVGIVLLASAAVWSGNMMALRLSPGGAMTVSELLDELQIPMRLPNAPLMGEDGQQTPLWQLADRPRTIVSFYAPWCGPCQKELPELARQTRAKGNLLVVVSSNENPGTTRQQLDNLGLRDVKFFMDTSGEIAEQGRVKSVPTTFLVGKMGKVRERVVGYSSYRLRWLVEKATKDGD